MSERVLSITLWVTVLWIVFLLLLALDQSFYIFGNLFFDLKNYHALLVFDGLLSLLFSFLAINYFFWRRFWLALMSTVLLSILHNISLIDTYRFFNGENEIMNHDQLVIFIELAIMLDGLIFLLSKTRFRKWLKLYGIALIFLSTLSLWFNQTSVLSLEALYRFNELLNYLYPLAAILFLINLKHEKVKTSDGPESVLDS